MSVPGRREVALRPPLVVQHNSVTRRKDLSHQARRAQPVHAARIDHHFVECPRIVKVEDERSLQHLADTDRGAERVVGDERRIDEVDVDETVRDASTTACVHQRDHGFSAPSHRSYALAIARSRDRCPRPRRARSRNLPSHRARASRPAASNGPNARRHR